MMMLAYTAVGASAPPGPSIGLPPVVHALDAPGPLDGVRSYAYSRYSTIDIENATQTQEATQDVVSRVRADLDSLRLRLGDADLASPFVRESYTVASGAATTWAGGSRTNLSKAQNPLGLSEAILALYAAHGITLTTGERLKIEQDAAALAATAPDVAVAGSLAAYATIDALAYFRTATANLDHAAWEQVLNHSWRLSDTYDYMNITEGQDAHLGFPEDHQAYLEVVKNYTGSVDSQAYAQALDVLAQSVDDIQALTIPPRTTTDTDAHGCTVEGRALLTTPHCLFVLGDWSGVEYRIVSTDAHDRFAVLVDFGGSDTYTNRAGTGELAVGVPSSGCAEFGHFNCRRPIQLNIDLGSDNDLYKPGARSGPMLGSAWGGVGLLYEAGGNDRYHTDETREVTTMGAALGGAALLFDRAGNDSYLTEDRSGETASFSHGAGLAAGLGLLRDTAGSDQYRQSPGNSGTPFFGGGQGFGTARGVGILFDDGTSRDIYEAFKDEAQGAGALNGHGLLFDEGGSNEFVLQAQAHTCVYRDTLRDCPQAVAGYARGYADTSGTGVLVTGTGADTFLVFGNADGNLSVGARMFGAGNTSGLGVHYDRGGPDAYEGTRFQSLGYAQSGLGFFVNVGGDDTYRCDYVTCYGNGTKGALGIYYDGVSASDIYPDNLTHEGIWQRGELGIGLHVRSSGSGGGGGGLLYERFISGPGNNLLTEAEA